MLWIGIVVGVGLSTAVRAVARLVDDWIEALEHE